ncbi:hypothetical protein M948_16460 [Virgibacillus sp. CM-4]|nr:hypothetical protein M948_16460 [Virgibacillus sp. CM-4]
MKPRQQVFITIYKKTVPNPSSPCDLKDKKRTEITRFQTLFLSEKSFLFWEKFIWEWSQ